MDDFDDLIDDLKQQRDELRVQINLASKEAKQEWHELEGKMEKFSAEAKLAQTGSGVSAALSLLGNEIKLGYQRVREALKHD
jgi:vacuolar-type H+-ATPase subunit D/Vma8